MTDQVVLTQTQRVLEESKAGTVVQQINTATTVITGNTDQITLTQTERVLEESKAGTVVQRIDDGTIIITGMMGPRGPAGISKISDSEDVNKTNLADGSILVYEASTTKWVATNELSKQTIDGGSY
jgi:hypothetical protein